VTPRRLAREVVLNAAASLGALCIVVAAASWVFGATLLVFHSGSMSPSIKSGALAVAVERPVSDLEAGDVVSVVGEDGVRVTHRVVSVRDRGLLLRGDANPEPDPQTYAVEQADVVVASVPHVGRVLDEASHGWWLLAEGALAGTAVGLTLRPQRRGRRERVRDRRVGAVATGLALALVASAPLVRTMAALSDTAR
jgi:signal peptidase